MLAVGVEAERARRGQLAAVLAVLAVDALAVVKLAAVEAEPALDVVALLGAAGLAVALDVPAVEAELAELDLDAVGAHVLADHAGV